MCRINKITVDRQADRWWRDVQGRTIQTLGSICAKDRQRCQSNVENRKNGETKTDRSHKVNTHQSAYLISVFCPVRWLGNLPTL
jgi:hypothetical protein